MTDPFAHDDAAYVMGALRGDELAAFEEHLATCAACRSRVAEIEPMMHVLADLTADDLAQPALDAGPPDTLLPALRARIRHERRRRWATTAVGAVAAACILAVALVLTTGRDHRASTSPAVAMSSLVSTPVHATARIDARSWGTQITLACKYDRSYPPDVEYALVVTDRSGATHAAGTWRLTPNGTTHFTGGTSVQRDDIARVDITAGDRPILELVP